MQITHFSKKSQEGINNHLNGLKAFKSVFAINEIADTRLILYFDRNSYHFVLNPVRIIFLIEYVICSISAMLFD